MARRVIEVSGGDGRESSVRWNYCVKDISNSVSPASLFRSQSELIQGHYVLSYNCHGKHVCGVSHEREEADSVIHEAAVNFAQEQDHTSLRDKSVFHKKGPLKK
ncbi:hypothetical protein CMI41_00525 [Candidatus Pacearchaeota archaeon]|nr:hypothetical protein [Candidatus Pacearchaeota archaeon]